LLFIVPRIAPGTLFLQGRAAFIDAGQSACRR